jgi:NitT/TauT family transport system permease protein
LAVLRPDIRRQPVDLSAARGSLQRALARLVERRAGRCDMDHLEAARYQPSDRVVLAFAFTVLARVNSFVDDAVELATSMLNPLPSVAMLPIAIIWFGLNVNSLIFVVVNAVVWPVTLNISTGFRTANQTLVNVGRVLGLSWWRMVTDVLFPAALPYTMTGLKTGLGYGWRTIIAAELVFGISGSKSGLGNYLNDARYFLRTDEVFAGIISVAVIGIILEAGFNWIERRTIVRWGMKQTTATIDD